MHLNIFDTQKYLKSIGKQFSNKLYCKLLNMLKYFITFKNLTDFEITKKMQTKSLKKHF